MREIQRINEELKDTYEQLEKAYLESVQTIRYTVEAKDPYTRGHSDRVSAYSVLIGEKLGLSEKDLKTLEGTTANVTNTISESGKYYLYVKAQDKAENESEKWSEPFNVINKADVENTIKIAKEPDGWTNEDVKVTVDYGNILTTFRRQGFGKTENEARQDAINNTIQTKNPITVTVKENGIIYVLSLIHISEPTRPY